MSSQYVPTEQNDFNNPGGTGVDAETHLPPDAFEEADYEEAFKQGIEDGKAPLKVEEEEEPEGKESGDESAPEKIKIGDVELTPEEAQQLLALREEKRNLDEARKILDADKTALDQAQQQIQGAMQLYQALGNPNAQAAAREFMQKIQGIQGESDPRLSQQMLASNPYLQYQQMLPKLERLIQAEERRSEEEGSKAVEAALDQVKEALGESYTDDLMREIAAEAYQSARQSGAQDPVPFIHAAAFRRVRDGVGKQLENAKNEGRQEVAERLAQAGPGARLLTSGKKSGAAGPKFDPVKASWEDIEAKMVQELRERR